MLVEVFILPGFGVFGLGGGTLIVVSLILASQTFVVPHNEYQLNQLPRSMMMVAATGPVISVDRVFVMVSVDRLTRLRVTGSKEVCSSPTASPSALSPANSKS